MTDQRASPAQRGIDAGLRVLDLGRGAGDSLHARRQNLVGPAGVVATHLSNATTILRLSPQT